MNDQETAIFDWLIEQEDKYLENVREHMMFICEQKYGDIGKAVCKKYYDIIDGVSDDQLEEVTCESCKEKREEVSNNLKLIDDISKCTQSYAYDIVKETITADDLKEINKEINLIINKINNGLLQYNNDELRISILIKLFKEKGV